MLNKEAGPYVKTEISFVEGELGAKRLGDFSGDFGGRVLSASGRSPL